MFKYRLQSKSKHSNENYKGLGSVGIGKLIPKYPEYLN